MLNSMDSKSVLENMSKDFPLHQMYRFFNRFFMHGQRQFSGWLPGEREEPGFTAGAMFALLYEFNHLDQPLTTEVIERIHLNVISGVLNTNYSPWEVREHHVTFRQPGEYVGFGLIPGSNLSPTGLEELKSECPHPELGYELRKSHIGQSERSFYKLACLSDRSEEKVMEALEHYHRQLNAMLMSNPQEAEALALLCRLISDLERLHPYADGNCRTFGIIVLNRELVRLGFLPTLMDDPNQFDGYSQQELITKIKEGQQRYLELLNEHHLTQTPYRSAVMKHKPSQRTVTKRELSQFDLTDLSVFEFKEPFEFVKGQAFQGEPQQPFEYLLVRMITESAITKLHAKEPSFISGRLISRLEHMDEEFKGLKANALEENLEHFYHKDMSDILVQSEFEVRLSLLKAAFRFGATSAVDYLADALTVCSEPLSNYVIEDDVKKVHCRLNLLGVSVQQGRYQIAERCLSTLPLEQLEEVISQDLNELLDKKKWDDIVHYLFLLSESQVYDSVQDLKLALIACAKSYKHFSSSQEDTQIIDSMLRLFHIKSEPLPVLEKLFHKLIRGLQQDTLNSAAVKSTLNELPKDVKDSVNHYLRRETIHTLLR